MKQKRARSPEAKMTLFNNIIKEGRDLFLEYGVIGFNMRSLARKLNLSQGSLYTYVSSKRELWYAIIKEDLQILERQMMDLRYTHQGKRINLIEKEIRLFFETIKSDSKLLQLMFKTSPPSSKKIGPIEKQFEIGIIRILEEIISEAVKNKEIKIADVSKLALYIWSLMYGSAIIAHTDVFGPKENLQGFDSSIEYYNFVIQRINGFINSLRK